MAMFLTGLSAMAFDLAVVERGGQHYAFVDGFRMARRKAINKVYRVDLTTMASKVLWEGTWDVQRVLIQPNGECLAVHIELPGRNVWKVIFLDFEGNVLNTLEGIHGAIAWSPDGSLLAYTSGKEIDMDNSVVTGIWLYNVKSKERKQVPTEGVTLGEGTRLAWLTFDNRLYAILDWEGPFMTYEANEHKWIPSSYASLRFSPTEKYYVVGSDGRETEPIHVYLRDEKQDVTSRLPILARTDLHKGVEGWASDHHLCFQKREPPIEEYMLDCDTGTVFDIPGRVITLVNGNKTIVVASGEGVIKLLDFAHLTPQEISGNQGHP